MCIVDTQTKIFSDGHRENTRIAKRCHRAPVDGICDIVEYKDLSSVRVEERKPSGDRRSSSREIITTDNSGRQRRYIELSRRSTKRTSTGRSRPVDSQLRIDSPTSSSPLNSSYTTMPLAPSPPPLSGRRSLQSPRRVSFDVPEDTTRMVAPDGTAIYSRVSSTQIPNTGRASDRLERQSSISSLTGEVDDAEPLPRRPSLKRLDRLSTPGYSSYGSSNTASSASSPGLSNLPRLGHFQQDSGTDLPLRDFTKTDTRRRADSTLQESYRQSREESDAQMLRDQLAKSERKRASANNDLRPSVDDDALRESSNERRRRIRRETQAALEGAQEADKRRSQIENDRKLAAEYEQIENEKLKKRARDSSGYTPNPYTPNPFEPSSPASSSRSTRTTYEYPTSPVQQRRPLPSARQMTDTTEGAQLPTRTPRYGNVQVHNPPPASRMDPLAERGDRVIQREQMRAVENETKRMNDMLERTNLRDQMEDDGFDELYESEFYRSSSRRYEGGGEGRRRRRYHE
ncbi:hypothetical protein AC578_10347 [Pseudocercospora eumusae]|uniref:Uncharacterized protein n=1 Tax=Pseudocercospora eumusae TaxID=321146 RepID=A0A139HRK9_9PEZI|nr:hypothetical protein AC578_10347 [Pseudocercospora eumusae]